MKEITKNTYDILLTYNFIKNIKSYDNYNIYHEYVNKFLEEVLELKIDISDDLKQKEERYNYYYRNYEHFSYYSSVEADHFICSYEKLKKELKQLDDIFSEIIESLKAH